LAGSSNGFRNSNDDTDLLADEALGPFDEPRLPGLAYTIDAAVRTRPAIDCEVRLPGDRLLHKA
jgi:hypothetical protein